VHRLLNDVIVYFIDLGRSATRAWGEFFFKPADPTSLGIMRVAVGGLLFWNVAVLGPDLRDYLGSDGWIGPEAAQHYLREHSPWAWTFWFWVPDRWLYPAWAACLIALALFACGFRSRVTAVMAWVIAVSTVRRAPAALFGFDQMIATWTMYLAAFGASGQALSLDRYWLRRRGVIPRLDSAPAPTVSANLSLRTIQLHLALVYGTAGLSKLMGPEWWNGTAMEMIILTPEYRRFDLTVLTAFPLLLSSMTHAGLFLEISYPVLIWVRKLRPLILAAVVLMHLGIDFILGLTEFGLTMIAANLAFVSGAWIRRLNPGAEPPTVLSSSDRDADRDARRRRERKRSTAADRRGVMPADVEAPARWDGSPGRGRSRTPAR
jgi:HTTM domain